MANPPDDRATPNGSLNDAQLRHLLASCRYIDRLLSDVDTILMAAGSQSPFARYANDLTPALHKLLRDYFVRIRADMLRVLERHGAPPAGERTSARHAVRVSLGFVEIALEELKAQYMRGYGDVAPGLEPELNGLAEELKGLVATLDRALAAGAGGAFDERLRRLERGGANVGVIQTLARVIDEQGLVEFRPALDLVMRRLEDRRFEVAVFGRVSSGKSSLLNHLLDAPVLPVGVTPITALPTRVVYGETPEVDVTFADRRPERLSIGRLSEFVTEQANPANEKHVTQVLARLPARRLASGIVFVDTPGLGSLATAGAAETLAYLPRCDLALVLIDAASTLTPDDLATLHKLQAAAIPAMVVLSKADLLAGADLEQTIAYTNAQASRELGGSVGVHAVSIVPGHEGLLDDWIREELDPLLARHQELARQSVQRKVGALRASVEATLDARVARAGAALAPRSAGDTAAAGQELRAAAGAFEDTRRAIDQLDIVQPAEVRGATERVAASVADALTRGGEDPSSALVARALIVIGAERAEALARRLTALTDVLQRALARAAGMLGVAAPVTSDEWASLLRELPQLDPGPLTVDLRLPLLGGLGAAVARARVAHALRAQAGDALDGALATHGRLLRHWGLRALAQLRQQFDVQAQIYQVRLGHEAAGEARVGAAETAAPETALRDLAALDRLPPPGDL